MMPLKLELSENFLIHGSSPLGVEAPCFYARDLSPEVLLSYFLQTSSPVEAVFARKYNSFCPKMSVDEERALING